MTPEQLSTLWHDLRHEAITADKPVSRVYRALGETTVGVRASYRPEEDRTELLVEVPVGWQHSRPMPEWQGIDMSILSLQLGSDSPNHLSLTLEDSASEDVFLYFTSDLTSELEGITDSQRRARTMGECIDKWNRFFLRAGPAGLSLRSQMGLFGELCLLKELLNSDLPAVDTLTSWKGPDRGYHDFDIDGQVIEVKTTSGKEPRKIWISNERQLDDRGTVNLYLLVYTIARTKGGGKTLPEMIESIRGLFRGEPGAEPAYQRKLIQTGYLLRHEMRYKHSFTVLKTELFSVTDSIPRIVELPTGMGDIRYSVLVSSCSNSSVDYYATIAKVIGGLNANT